MSVLKETREELAQLLASVSDKRAYPYLPESVAVPAYVLVDGNQYISEGDTFGSVTLSLDALYYTRASANSVGTADLDAEIEGAVIALINAGWNVEGVSLEALRANGNEYLGAVISLTRNINF